MLQHHALVAAVIVIVYRLNASETTMGHVYNNGARCALAFDTVTTSVQPPSNHRCTHFALRLAYFIGSLVYHKRGICEEFVGNGPVSLL